MLTDKNKKVLTLLVNGYTAKEIASYQGVSINAIKQQMGKLYRGYEVTGHLELIVKFYKEFNGDIEEFESSWGEIV